MSPDTLAPQALIVDDEAALRELAAITLERMGIVTACVADLAGARAALATQRFDFCLTDMRLPDGSGLSLIQHIQQHYPQLPVAMITAHGNMESAIEALKAGAFDFVNKPVDLQVLRELATQALSAARHKGRGDPGHALVGVSPTLLRLKELIRKLARSQAPVHISGESGTGKELVARLIHEQGPRAQYPFVPVNCGALPPDLVESELFGHRKGSFTGAVADHIGLFQAAAGGTLFLDEVGDLPLVVQVKLLRALQERRVKPVGAAAEVEVDVRVVAATNRDLRAEVAKKAFREDLYYRLAVIRVSVPPLRERGADIPLLVQHFVEAFGPGLKVSPDDLARLVRHAWPGNVRELRNAVERACLLARNGQVTLDDIVAPEGGGAQLGIRTDLPFKEAKGQLVEMFEREYIEDLMRRHKMNLSAASREAQIDRKHLRELIRKYGLDPRARLDGDGDDLD